MLKNIIIIDNQSYPLGGTAQVAYASAIELSKRGYNVVYIAADEKPNLDLVRCGIDVRTIYNPSINRNPNKFQVVTNGVWDFRMERETAKILAKYDTQSSLIHIHGYLHCFSPSVLKACKKSGIRTILTLHDYFILCPCGGLYNFQTGKICTLDPMSLECRRCNCDKRSYVQKIWRMIRQHGISKYARDNKELELIYISEFSYSKMGSVLGGKHKAYFVMNPYDIGDGKKYKAENAHNYIFLGRLSRGKGVDIFCEALTDLIKEGNLRGEAIIVGDGDEREKLENQFPLIKFLGWKKHEDFGEIFESARALVFPSRWYEGAPLTPIEFMAHGIPCIISDSNAGKDYILDEKDGLIFKSEDIDSLKSTIMKVEEDRYWGEICDNLRNTFNESEYAVETHVDNLIKVYENRV